MSTDIYIYVFNVLLRFRVLNPKRLDRLRNVDGFNQAQQPPPVTGHLVWIEASTAAPAQRWNVGTVNVRDGPACSIVLFCYPSHRRSHDTETPKALEGVGELEHDRVVVKRVHLTEP